MNPSAEAKKGRDWQMWRKTGELLIAFGATSFLCGLLLSVHYSKTLPKMPIATEGRTYVLDDHGAFVFMNQRERTLLNLSIWSGWLVGICGTAINRYSTRVIKRLAAQSSST
jgi:hypothetical protein